MRLFLLAAGSVPLGGALVVVSGFVNHPRRIQPINTKLWVEDSERAGKGGYSVLRQPVQWDPDADPVFDVPTSLRDDSRNSFGEAQWMKRKQTSTSTTPKKATTSQNSQSKQSAVTNMADLDLFQRTLDTLDYPIVLNALMDACTTVPACNLVREGMDAATDKKRKEKVPKDLRLAYQPLTATSFEGLEARYTAVREMEWLVDGQNDAITSAFYRNGKGYKEQLGPPPMTGMTFDLTSILALADAGQVLEGPEVLDVVTMMDALENLGLWKIGLGKVEGELEFVQLPRMADCITVNSTLQDLLHNAFDKEGRLSGKTFPKIGQLRAMVRTLKNDVLETLDTLLATPSISSKLALESGGPSYSEVNGRIVVPVDERHSRSSLGIIHDSSRSGRTLYVEPTELVAPTNELRQAESELRMEEARIWRLLTEEILQNRVELEAAVAAAGQLDLTMARLSLGKKLNGVIPQVGYDGIISLRDAKHPVLLLREIENVVGSDIDLGADSNQGLVLTGPNSGGKTVILKLLGLVALMARNGIPIPANRQTSDHTPRVDFFDPVLADIGDIQSVGGDLSTFSGHMLVCREVLAKSGENALVLMDELGSGTDPAQGVAIAQALLEALVDNGSRVAITTHYMELKQLASSDARFEVAGMQFVGGRPTYKLLPGTVGESFALAVAERLELPTSVLERASELLDSETRQMGDLIRELEDQKALVDAEAEEMVARKKEMGKLELQLKSQQLRLEEKQLSVRRSEAKKFASVLEEKERVLEEVLEKLKRDPSRKVVAKSWDDIRFVKRDAINEAENVESVVRAKKEKETKLQEQAAELVPITEMREKPNLSVGDVLVVCQMGSMFGEEAILQTVGKRPQVLINDVTVRMKLSNLALPNGMVVPTRKSTKVKTSRISKAVAKALEDEARDGPSVSTPQKSARSGGIGFRMESNTVKVLGCRVDEAKMKIKRAASSTNHSVLYILHGYGTTGALRSQLRDWLRTEKSFVKSFRPASIDDGGDSFTMVELK